MGEGCGIVPALVHSGRSDVALPAVSRHMRLNTATSEMLGEVGGRADVNGRLGLGRLGLAAIVEGVEAEPRGCAGVG